MIETIKKYPEMCADAIKLAEKVDIPDYKFDKIVVCGMGGSAVSGDLLKDLLKNRISIPIAVCRDYHLPAYVDEKTLTFCISYSGNTEETLSQFVDCIKKKSKIIGISSGGKLEEWCKRFKLPYVSIPSGYQPRSALPYLLFSMIVCLQKNGVVNLQKEIDETIELLKRIKTDSIKKLANSMKDSTIIVYSSDEFSGVARRVKTQINENSKMPAKYDVFPELDHNEIVGYQNERLNKNCFVLILRDKDEPEEIKARIEITKGLIKDKVKGMEEIWAEGKSKLARMMSLIFLGDALSYELAVLNDVDPVEVENIGILKKKLTERLNLVEKLEKDYLNRPL
ncbi:MAG: bifunctional phosphoglucose/phosphomannose isomerase [Candidatus Aenigmarchaeota archaeon]|nr:bifunctional phosphoglucose/phosphomannose isomerase [Candidatus Aenigmarchaeota archaeon]